MEPLVAEAVKKNSCNFSYCLSEHGADKVATTLTRDLSDTLFAKSSYLYCLVKIEGVVVIISL